MLVSVSANPEEEERPLRRIKGGTLISSSSTSHLL